MLLNNNRNVLTVLNSSTTVELGSWRWRLVEPGSNQARGRRYPWQPWEWPPPMAPPHWTQSVEYLADLILTKGRAERGLKNKARKVTYLTGQLKQANPMQTMGRLPSKATPEPWREATADRHWADFNLALITFSHINYNCKIQMFGITSTELILGDLSAPKSLSWWSNYQVSTLLIKPIICFHSLTDAASQFKKLTSLSACNNTSLHSLHRIAFAQKSFPSQCTHTCISHTFRLEWW